MSACTVALVESDLSPFTPMTTPRLVPCVAAGGVEVGSGSGVGARGSRVGLRSGCGSVERGETDLSPIMPMSPSCPVPYVLAGEAGIGAGSGLCAPVQWARVTGGIALCTHHAHMPTLAHACFSMGRSGDCRVRVEMRP